MSFRTYFRLLSYATVAVAMLTLVLADGLSVPLGALFVGFMILAWNLEDTRWRMSERLGLVVVLISIPLFFLDWKYQRLLGEPSGRVGVNALAHLILFLSAVKLLQAKKDRDWIFLYLISFFEVLLAAGLSFSPVFLGSLTLYLICVLSTIVAFEIQKSKRLLVPAETRLLVPPDSRIFKKASRQEGQKNVETTRLPLVAAFLFVLIFVLALPLFLIAPRSGAAAITRASGGLSNFVGFSETVTLGQIGELKRDNAVVMHIRIEDGPVHRQFRWRGIALDEFTGRSWRKSAAVRRAEKIIESPPFFQLGTTEALHRLTTQTIFLEPIESPVLFAASRPVAIQGDLPYIRVDAEGSVQTRRHEFDRLIYKALSDTTQPDASVLRSDFEPYPTGFERYLQLPATLDPRIEGLTNAIVANAHARTRYDVAKAIESGLQNDFGYTLEMKAGGPDPLADFLFNIKAGHCEYFSTAMAVMLRTRGIAARVVNGFLPGEYNEAAGAYTVRQSDAHSWVEVYFPETRSWVTFDPTPAAGRVEPVTTGLTGQLGKYAEALELIWFQYVVGYDRQEQRALATSLRNSLFDYRRSATSLLAALRQAFGSTARFLQILAIVVVTALLIFFVIRRARRFGWRRALGLSPPPVGSEASAVIFYERLIALLARKGLQRDPYLTPLEFAGTIELQSAITITRAYNRVRYGGERLSPAETKEIEQLLSQLDNENRDSSADN